MNKEEILSPLAENIRLYRFRCNITQEALAEASGISTKYLNSIENKKANPTIVIVANIAKALNVDVNKLLRKNED